MPRKGKSKKSAKGPVQLERSTLTLLGLCGLALVLWAGLASLAAYHFRTRLEVAHIKLEDAFESLSDVRQRNANHRQASRADLVEAEILREQVANLFDQLLSEKYKPQTTAELMSSFQKVYNKLTGETLDYKEMQQLLSRLREVLGLKGGAPLEPVAPPKPAPVKPAPAVTPKPKPVVTPKPPPATTRVEENPASVPAPPKGQIRSDAYRYGITFPDDWQIRSEGGGAGVLASSPRSSFKEMYTGYVVLNAHHIESGAELNRFFNQNLEQITKGLADYEEVNIGTMRLGGLPARYVRCRYKRVNTPFEAIYIMVVREHIGYVVSFSTTVERYAEFQNAFNRIAGTVVFF